ncbi:MAG: cardiolipin synthase [Bacilli bacterium]|nr:cardiolipin synthase [Bacilli bacterium]
MLKLLKNIFRFFMSKVFIISSLILIQFAVIIFLAIKLWQFGIIIYIIFTALSVIASLFILNRPFNPAYKLSWIMLVLVVPFAGYIFYLIFGSLRLSRRRKAKIKFLHEQLLEESKKYSSELVIEDPNMKKLANYIYNVTGLKPWDNTISKFLPSGEEFHENLLEQLEKAEKFIFMEYFIIREGEMWESIKSVLARKVKEGVDVRLIYDDFGTINKVGYKFKSDLINLGIKVVNFNPYRPRLTMIINYRDHRKITIIDGNIGFVGGANLADEYINRVRKFGYWKDATVMIKGEAVWNLTLLFFQMWEYSTEDKFDYTLYRPTLSYPTTGCVLPFGDGPLDGHQTIEMSYINIISNAKKYVYITSPYLVLDNELATCLKTAAQSGVDVRIMMPHIPDKKIVFMISRSYYQDLVEAGVKIYEFLPGFLHSKYLVADDEVAIVGTANLDYRSFYLHYEVVTLLYNNESVMDVKADFDKATEVCHLVTLKEAKNIPILKRALVSFLRVFSPMI